MQWWHDFVHYSLFCYILNSNVRIIGMYGFGKLGPVSISDKTSYRKISWSLEVARLLVWIIASLWNLTAASAAVLPRCLSNFRAIGRFQTPISRLRDFTRSYHKTSYRILKQSLLCLFDCQYNNCINAFGACSSHCVYDQYFQNTSHEAKDIHLNCATSIIVPDTQCS